MAMSLLIRIIVILSLFSPRVSAVDECPQGEELHEGECFSFHQEPSVTNFQEAKAFCKDNGKQLARINNQKQTYELALSSFERNWTDVLVGLRYEKVPWQWASKGRPLRGQGCFENGDADQTMVLGYSSSSIMTIDKCIQFCSNEGHLYAAVHMGSFCYCSDDHIWKIPASNCSTPCAGSETQLCGGTVNSATYFAAENAFDNWQPSRPSVYGNCAAIQVDGKLNQWQDASCAIPLPFICQYHHKMELQSYDADTHTCDQQFCYQIFSTIPESWMKASRFCKSRGGELVVIQNQYMQDTINKLLYDWGGVDVLVWIGASDRMWFFPDGAKLNFDGWIVRNEPVAPGAHSCSSLVVDIGGEYGFTSTRCDHLEEKHHRFICSPASSIFDLPPTTTSPVTTKQPTTLANSQPVRPASAAEAAAMILEPGFIFEPGQGPQPINSQMIFNEEMPAPGSGEVPVSKVTPKSPSPSQNVEASGIAMAKEEISNTILSLDDDVIISSYEAAPENAANPVVKGNFLKLAPLPKMDHKLGVLYLFKR